MPEVQSDIKVLVTPAVGPTDLSTLRQQVEDAFKTPINVKINMGDIAVSARKQAERAAKATKSAFSKVQVTPGKTFFKEFSDQFTKQTPEIKKLGTYYSQLQKQAERAAREFSKVQVIPGKTFFEEFSNQFTKQTPEIKRLGEYYGQLQKQAEQAAEATRREFSKVQVIPGKTFFEEFSDQFTKQTPEIKRLGEYYGQLQKQAEQAAKAAESANKAALGRGQTALAGWDTKAEGQNVQRLKQYNDELQRAYDNAKALVEQGQPNAADTKGWEALADAIEKYRVELSKALRIQDSNNAVAQTKKNYEDVQRQAESYFKKYETNITRNLSLSTKWQNLLNNLRNPDIDNTSVVEYREQLAKLINESQAAGVEIEKTGQKLSRLFGQHLSTAVAMAAVHALRRVLQQTYQTVIEFDKALVDLQVSSGKSRSELKSLMMQYSEFAKSLGTTTIAVTQAADTWLRQGYDLSEVETLITDSIHLSVLGKIDSEEATKALTSTMKGYGIAVQDASTIVDKFTTVDMNAATSAGDLATAMAECAVSAKLAGVDIDRLTGYLAVVAETSQDGAESVGVFFKSMFARMGNIKAGRLVDPETDEDLSNVETVLNSLGIKLRNNEKDWRNFGDVLDDVAARWNSFSDTQRRAIANAFGQTRNQEKFLILMDQYQTAAEYADISANSTGNAAEKYEAYMDGIEAHINQLTATFEKFSQTVLNSDMVKEGVDFLTNILNLLQQITAWSGNAGFGALTPLFGLGGGILGASGKGRLQQVGLAANMPLYALVATRNELAA